MKKQILYVGDAVFKENIGCFEIKIIFDIGDPCFKYIESQMVAENFVKYHRTQIAKIKV